MTGLTFPNIPFPLSAEGSPASTVEIDGDAVRLVAGPESDLFIDPAGSDNAPDAGRFLGEPSQGDFTFRAHVTVDFGATFDAAVLMVHTGASQWAKLCFEFSPQGRASVVSVITRGTSDDANHFEVAGNSVWLRVTRTGRAWAFHASTDGVWWSMVRYFALDEQDGNAARVGFLAQSPTGKGCSAVFDNIEFSAGAPTDLRDGS